MENNDRMSAWNKFVSTGSVADYLSYSQKKEPQGEINKKKEENKKRVKGGGGVPGSLSFLL